MKTTKQLLTLAILMGIAGQLNAIVSAGGYQPNQSINVAGKPPYNPQPQPKNLPG